MQDINRELERQLHAREATIIEKDAQITELKAQKDVATALIPVLDAMTNHEHRANERHVAMLAIMDLIAQHLGKELNGD